MNDASKHVGWILGLAGWGGITLAQWNTIVGISCGTAGFIYACLGIYSWFEKRRKKAREAREAKHKTTDYETTDKERRRHHHLWLFWVVLGLVAWVLIAAAAEGQTPNTEAEQLLSRTSALGSSPTAQADWHGYTVWHLLALTVMGWITHANWKRLLPAYRWIQGEGGVGMILWTLIWNPKTKTETGKAENRN